MKDLSGDNNAFESIFTSTVHCTCTLQFKLFGRRNYNNMTKTTTFTSFEKQCDHILTFKMYDILIIDAMCMQVRYVHNQ